MKKLFTAIAIGTMMMTAGAVSTFAAGITKEEAKQIAVSASGVDTDQIVFTKTLNDLDDGRDIFEIDFVIPGEVKYEFDIDVNTGKIIDKDMDLWNDEDDFEYSVLFEKEVKRADADGEISQKQAKTIALKDAGLLKSEVTFTRCEKDMDDGMINFEIKFFGLDGREYEYKISAIDGSIIGKDYEFDHDHEFYDYDDHEFYDYDDDDFDGAFDFD